MGQSDIIKVLKKTDKYLTCKQIAKLVGINHGNVSLSIKKMRNCGELKQIIVKEHKSEAAFRKSYDSFAYQLK